MTIGNLHARVCEVSSIKHGTNIGLLAKAQVLCNFITDVGALKGSAADPRHEKARPAKSYTAAPLSARSRQSVMSLK